MTVRRFLGAVSAVAATMIAGPLAAQEPELDFAISDDLFTVTVPEGFCEPEGEYAEIALQYATGDTRNVTPVDLQRCGTFEEDYILVKAPRGLDPVELPKAEFLAGLAEELKQANPIQSGEKRGYVDMRDETEGDRDIAIVKFGYRGSDDQCAYLGGELLVTFSDGRKEPVYVGSCGTLIGNRHLFVHSYARVASGATVESMKARSRAVSGMIAPK
ncbi:hypothetical protein [Erythrobacter sp. F6033]|uniref:hypothetical protein n=1 Tax=Erythrobacter sp. F6033 TaxID=2926401 RepID=UPI001FF1996A|nr:hypothetical protein [Erythrobacter sp. F6033]MCK0127879.1 hypothetical protein [Erythrobacter sp. F6033]